MRRLVVDTSTMFPAQAGVILVETYHINLWYDVPRAGGGDPMAEAEKAEGVECSPRRRG